MSKADKLQNTLNELLKDYLTVDALLQEITTILQKMEPTVSETLPTPVTEDKTTPDTTTDQFSEISASSNNPNSSDTVTNNQDTLPTSGHVQSDDTPPKPPVFNQQEKRKKALSEMRYFACWRNGAGESQWQKEYKKYMLLGGNEVAAQQTKNQAKEIQDRLDTIKREISKSSTYSMHELPPDATALLQSYQLHQYFIKKELEYCFQKKTEYAQIRDYTNKKNTDTTNTDKIAHTKNTMIQNLPHKPSWDLLIDESGSSFSADGNRDKSYFVGVLAPSYRTTSTASVEPLATHATEVSIDTKFNTLKSLIQRPDWSIFGIRLSNVIAVQGEQWIDGVTELISWVIRLLPVSEPTILKVFVEQREPHVAGSEQSRIERVLLQNLAKINSIRANLLTLDIRLVYKYKPNLERVSLAKGEEYPTHPWLAYADLLANLWYSQEKVYKTWLKESNLLHQFLHNDLSPQHQRLLDVYLREPHTMLSGEDWSLLVKDSLHTKSSVLQYINTLWKERTQKDIHQWNQCMNEVQQHLYSKAIHMPTLMAQSQWLKEVNAKQIYSLSQRDALVFDTCQLANNNHMGLVISLQDITKLQEKQKNLEYEDIRLLCLLDTHLAVQLTHTFTFDSALTLLRRWEQEDTKTIGVRYKGYVLSSIGQMLAFQDKTTDAISYFNQALALFDRLSSPMEANMEKRQTQSYKVIAMIDDRSFSTDAIEKEMLLLSPAQDMSELCRYILHEQTDANKYVHHIFLRYLYFRNPTTLVSLYLDDRKSWQSGENHPWYWINVYRGLLLGEHNGSQKEIQTHFSKTLEKISYNGVELALGTVFLELARQHNITLEEEKIDQKFIQKNLVQIQKQLPAATCVYNTLSTVLQQSNTNNRREWIAKALPFNFH